MSDSDSFIEEVTEEVRRDRLFGILRRYGWIAALVIVAIVGGAAWSEYKKSQTRAAAENLGDSILAALSADAPGSRQAGLETVTTDQAGGQVIVRFLAAAEAQQNGDIDAATAALDLISVDGSVAEIYRQIASFKSLILQHDTMDAAARREQFQNLAVPGTPLGLLAQEQLALLEVAEGNRDAAVAQYQAILQDAGVSSDLQQRALQVIVALGGTPDVSNLPGLGN